MKEKLDKYINKNLKKEKRGIFNFHNLFSYESEETELENTNDLNELDTNILYKSYSSNDINKYIESNKDYSDFQTTLFKMIDERNLKDNEVYNKVHIDRRLFSKIRSDKNYHPSKETVLLLGFSLELNELEIEKLLDSASYSLPKNNYYDLIIRFCFINKIYKLTDINNLIDLYNFKLFNY